MPGQASSQAAAAISSTHVVRNQKNRISDKSCSMNASCLEVRGIGIYVTPGNDPRKPVPTHRRQLGRRSRRVGHTLPPTVFPCRGKTSSGGVPGETARWSLPGRIVADPL